MLFASGVPGQVTSLSSSVLSTTGVSLSWSAPTFAGESSITSYVVTELPGGASVSYGTLSASITGLSFNTSYNFKVAAVNSVGSGLQSEISASTAGFNSASGGTETVVSDYNGTGETWKVHTFSSTGTLDIGSGFDEFKVLVLAGGGGGGGGSSHSSGGGGGAGGMIEQTLSSGYSSGSHTITVGSTGNASSALGISTTRGGPGNSSPGGSGGGGRGGSGFFGTNATGGGSGISGQGNSGGSGGQDGGTWTGAGGGGGGKGGSGGTPGRGAGVNSDITGTSTLYARGGNGGAGGPSGSPGSVGNSERSGPGIVVVAYRTA